MTTSLPNKTARLVDTAPTVVDGNRTVVAVAPTQTRRPWRTTVRTAFQGAIALASLAPFVAAGIYGDATDPADYAPAVAQVLAVSSAVTRVMAHPQVDAFLRRFAPFLSATGR